MRSRIETFIPRAVEAVSRCGIEKNGEVPKPFNGYIASFGASVRQAGLLATWLFYSNADSGAEEDRTRVLRAIEHILNKAVVEEKRKVVVSRDEVDDAAVALKLAVRTFRLV